jgi:rhamnose transport system permease protein
MKNIISNYGGKYSTIFYKKEFILFLVLILILILNSNISPYFFDLVNLIDSTFLFSEKAIVALSMTLIIISRQLDLSVASIIAISSCVLGYTNSIGLSTFSIISLTLFCGIFCGAFNGWLITHYAIPSIIVTIGTMSLFRGLSYVLLEDQYYSNFPNIILELGNGYFLNLIPYSFFIFIILTFLFAFFLHKTIFGKKIFAIGNNPEASKYSGINVNKYTFILFTLNGLFFFFFALFLSGRLSSVRPNIALGWELEIITMVVFGGVYIYGGSGSILGVFLSIIILGMLTFGLSLLNIPGVGIIIFTGLLLILTIALSTFIKNYSNKNV